MEDKNVYLVTVWDKKTLTSKMVVAIASTRKEAHTIVCNKYPTSKGPAKYGHSVWVNKFSNPMELIR